MIEQDFLNPESLGSLGVKIDIDHVNRVLKMESLTPVSLFKSGNTGNTVLLTRSQNNNHFVLKIPNDKRSQDEVIKNLRGYKKIREANLQELLPNIIKTGEIGEFTYICTSYLGNDFATVLQESKKPEYQFQKLVDTLEPLYSKTLESDTNSERFLEMIKQVLQKNIFQYLIPAGFLTEKDTTMLNGLTCKLSSPKSCFAVFDFTPEDIYLYPHTIKYPDAQEIIRGNPIIDLACFSGTSRDAYELPGSKSGYKVLEKFAVERVSNLLDLSRDQAQRIFYLGRATQLSLSSRVRISSSPKKAVDFANSCLEYLRLVNQ